ncbi:DDE-type integrase/transposase/recombinase [Oculatella sp. FACHB-28]|nr:DDE-type integrase/transposase/recombinase [Oculatella sp. FACHB-28]MBD2066364.1 DDE-type integrase/transposase/recombinase [Leptolyngbya sp. FACHB-671]
MPPIWTSEFDPVCSQRMIPERDETYIQIKGEWKYLYRAVDS